MAKVIGANKNEESKHSIYLAGHLNSDWQDKVITANNRFSYVDPRQIDESLGPDVYTWYDLNAIARCCAVVAYLGKDNPAGHNMAFECGFATCLRKPVFLIVDHNEFCGFVDMLKASCRVFYPDFDNFICYWREVTPELFSDF